MYDEFLGCLTYGTYVPLFKIMVYNALVTFLEQKLTVLTRSACDFGKTLLYITPSHQLCIT